MPQFQDDFRDDLPNPFAPEPAVPLAASVGALVQNLKWLALVVVALGCLIGLTLQRKDLERARAAELSTSQGSDEAANAKRSPTKFVAENNQSLDLPLSDVLASPTWTTADVANSGVSQTAFFVEKPAVELIEPVAVKLQSDDSIDFGSANVPLSDNTAQGNLHSRFAQVEPATSEVHGSTRTVIELLNSENETLRLQARHELSRRGLTQLEIGIAEVVVCGSVPQRLTLVEQVTQMEMIDARPWLLLMLRADDVTLRQSCVRALGKMVDPDVRHALRRHLMDETNASVAMEIRETLQDLPIAVRPSLANSQALRR